MCGIAGAINNSLDAKVINKVMLHRGPDEQNHLKLGNVQLFHLRLTILDAEGGKQPMSLDDRYTMVFNGEIYNHQELRRKYQLNCTSNSDTETLLHLYRKVGPKFLDDVDGMFALAIYDKKEKQLFLTRDRAGKKPLYIYQNGQQIVFASELNCIRALTDLSINEDHIYRYLRLGSMYRSDTPYNSVTEIKGGTYLYVNEKTLEIKVTKWWDINDFYCQDSTDSFSESQDKVESYLDRAIRNRIDTSDLEVGSFLSGGIDSGLVTAFATKHTDKLKTFTVSFDGEYNEAPLAKLVADQYKTIHTEIKISFDNLINDVEKILINYGEPYFDSSAIPSYYVSQEAKKYLTVILNGDGADELFGGYRRYVPFKKMDFFKSNLFTKKIAQTGFSMLPASNDKKSKYNLVYRLANLMAKEGVEAYLTATVDIFEGFQEHLKASKDYMDILNDDFKKINDSSLSGLKKIMNLDFDTILFSDLLVKMDIATMANSLEGRSPFLCKELLEYAPTMNDSFKINGKTTKPILRSLAKKHLPPQIFNQPKRGFEIPLKKWVEKDLKDLIYGYLSPSNAYTYNFLNRKFVQQLLDKPLSVPAEKRAKMLWTLFSLELWYQKVVR